ncbi:MAG: sulfate/molybdate ABC transporter ATP-binding protein [Rickettsiales endosymbiont of Dermacentor nuttalli]
MSIVIENVSKKKGHTDILNNINLKIESGELVALVGPSGSGKTTLLRIIAGLEMPDQGNVFTYNTNIVTQSPKDRKIGFVFQNYALFQHLTVFENVAFGINIMPKSEKPSKEEIENQVNQLLESMHISDLKDRYPAQLSGGQKQRVAIARALAISPNILLLDEPFGALDARVRKSLRSWMRQLHSEIKVTSVFVTHDQEEAMEVADRIVIMNHGSIEQIDTPAQIYQQPANEFVYDFLGTFNILDGIKDENGIIHIVDLAKHKYTKSLKSHWIKDNLDNVIQFFNQKLNKDDGSQSIANKGNFVRIFARPYDMELTKKPLISQEYIITKVAHIYPTSSTVKLELMRKNGSIVYAEITKATFDSLEIIKGEEIFVRPQEVTVFT